MLLALEKPSASGPMPATFWAFPNDTPESARRDIEIIKKGKCRSMCSGIFLSDAATGLRRIIRFYRRRARHLIPTLTNTIWNTRSRRILI